MSALPARIGATRSGMHDASYWLSASVLTITSAPSLSAASRPAWKPFARPLLLVSRTMWSTPHSRATSIVRSVEPSSMTSHSTVSKPGTSRGRSASVSGSVSSSLRQGIWMISFIATGKDGIAHVRLIDSYGGLHAHPAGAGHRSPAASDEHLGPRRHAREGGLRAAVRGLRHRVLRLSHL